jgi:hypothetical protein
MQLFQESSYCLVGKDGNIEYTPTPGVFQEVRMQVFNVMELNISMLRKEKREKKRLSSQS